MRYVFTPLVSVVLFVLGAAGPDVGWRMFFAGMLFMQACGYYREGQVADAAITALRNHVEDTEVRLTILRELRKK